MTSVSFTIFTYNSSELILKTLSHLLSAISFHNIENEIILIDNNSNDDTKSLVVQFAKSQNIDISIFNNPIQGLSFSRKLAVQKATKEYVCFIDDDNFVHENWNFELDRIISTYSPSIIGCRTIGISDSGFPHWWRNNSDLFACGSRFSNEGFRTGLFDKVFGAGMTAKRDLLEKAILNLDLFCTGRSGEKQLSGEDSELIYRLKLIGASLFFSDKLVLDHYMRTNRLTKKKLTEMRIGNAEGAIMIDIYRSLLSDRFIYKLPYFAIIICLLSIPLSIKYRINYLPFGIKRIKTLKSRRALQELVKKNLLEHE